MCMISCLIFTEVSATEDGLNKTHVLLWSLQKEIQKQDLGIGSQYLLQFAIHEKKCLGIKGPFTQSVRCGVSVSGRMDALPIHNQP